MRKKYLITYDVKDAHQYIITELTNRGWHSVMEGFSLSDNTPAIAYMPETTWWKEFNSALEASNEFKNIAGENNVIRFCVTIFDEWIASTTSPMWHQIEEVKKLK